jgi:hypothetical protein
MSTIVIRRSLAAIIFAAITLFSSNAVAQERHNPARECIEQIEAITARTMHSVHSIADRRIEAIRTLDANDAEEDQLRQLARTGRENIAERAQRGASRIQSFVQECVEFLIAEGAPQQAIMAVINAGQAGQQRIANGAERSIERINRNLYFALNN